MSLIKALSIVDVILGAFSLYFTVVALYIFTKIKFKNMESIFLFRCRILCQIIVIILLLTVFISDVFFNIVIENQTDMVCKLFYFTTCYSFWVYGWCLGLINIKRTLITLGINTFWKNKAFQKIILLMLILLNAAYLTNICFSMVSLNPSDKDKGKNRDKSNSNYFESIF